jgi:hypothetical protein
MRNGLQVLKDKNLSQLVGVEIGVWRGHNALSILQNLDIEMLYLVDSYLLYPEYNKNEIGSHIDMDANEAEARALLKPYEDRITWVIKKSHDAKDDIPDRLDFVYIDGNHSTNAIIQDMADYFPKVRSGGFFSGHDIWKEELEPSIDKFAKDRGYRYSQFDKPPNITWDQAGTDNMDWWWTK